ncbi:hypothetical protein [Plantactinospora sp. B5E13]|uniref:hypothetical protein n=1 Tax=unclassified Plantactinospora TaxID=2631981 RepID=UPI00325F13FF
MSIRTAVLAAATVLAVAGCTGSGTPTAPAAGVEVSGSATPSAQPGPTPPALRIVEKEQADLHLWVSNQSFEDDPVTVTVRIDDTVVVDQPFEVGSQHNWILFPIEAPPGPHVLTAVSGTGAETRQSFTLPGAERRYAVVDYWGPDDHGDRHLTWYIRSTPIAFR